VNIALPPRLASVDVQAPLLALLTRYVSAPTAQSILSLAKQRTGISSAAIDRAQLRRLIEPIERGLRLFVADPARAAECRAELDAMVNSGAEASTHERQALRIEIIVEDDVARARTAARNFSSSIGFSVLGQTRLTTAVSELARNIVLYAGSGHLELKSTSPVPGIEVVAHDAGPGISNLAQIMAGDYRSRFGMGLGLRGVKKLADRFDVVTGVGRGTKVTFMMRVA
jgi:serine/threonine-protein kinase RsbT